MTAHPEILAAGLGRPVPTYVYDLAEMERCFAAVESIPFERKSIHFATMANDHPALLARVRDLGHGIFVNSLRHLRLALELGFRPGKILYAASNMVAEEIETCLRHGVRLVLDSLGQVRLFSSLAGPGREIGVRVSVGSALDGRPFDIDPSYRFGLLPEELGAAVETARRAGVRIVGAHSYFGTDLLDPAVLLEGLARLTRAAEALPDLCYLDGAGGFGVPDSEGDEEFDVARYGREAALILSREERRRGHPLELVLEPGRFLAASCGYFFVRVVDVKRRPDRVFVGTNASVAVFPRPLLYPDRAVHPCAILGESASGPVHDLPVYICGNSTYSRDFLARAVRLPLPEPGDTIVFYNAGAYCRSMITEFLGRERPDELVLQGAAVGAEDLPVAAVG